MKRVGLDTGATWVRAREIMDAYHISGYELDLLAQTPGQMIVRKMDPRKRNSPRLVHVAHFRELYASLETPSTDRRRVV